MLTIKKDLNHYQLKEELWSGALDTINEIIEQDKLHDLIGLLEEMYPEPVDITTINDLLWFDDDFIYKELEIDDKGISCSL